MHVLLMMTMSFGPFSPHVSRGAKSIVLVWKFVFFFGLFFKCMLARKGFCMQTNKQKKWIPVVANGEKTSFFIIFLIICLLGKDFVCNKMTLLFYDGASDFFCWDCCFTTMPAIFF